MPALKCPNPSCRFLFDPSLVPPGAVLTCPRCGLRFTLGQSPAAVPPTPTNPEPAPTPAAAPPEPVRKRSGGMGGTVLALVGVSAVALLAVGAVVLAVMLRPRLTGDGGTAFDES